MKGISAIILTAGQGNRMKSALPKVALPVLGKPVVWHVAHAAREAGIREMVFVLGYGRDKILPTVDAFGGKVAIQESQFGTGDAARCGMAELSAGANLGILDADFDAAILRQPLLGDVQVAQDFDARNDGGLEALDLGWDGDLLQHPVNPVANAQLILERFQVNVGRPELNGVPQDLVHEPDDRGILRGGVEVRALVAVFVHHLDGRFLLQGVDGVGPDPETLLHLALDRFARGQHRFESQAGQRLERVQPLRRKQAAGGDLNAAIEPPQRQQFLLQENPRRKQREKLAIRLDVFQRRVGEIILLRQPAEHVRLPLERLLGSGLALPQQDFRVGRDMPPMPPMPDRPDMPPMPDIPPMPDMPPIPDIPDMPPMPGCPL